MMRFEEVKYMAKVEAVKPDANVFLRFATLYLSFITDEEMQTNEGVVLLPTAYHGPKLVHNDHIMVLARCLEKGRFEGQVTKVNLMAHNRYKELCWTMQNVDSLKPKPSKQPIDDHF